MKTDPNSPRDTGKSRDSKAERKAVPPKIEKTDESLPQRLHLLEHRGHRWARRNAHV